MTVIYVIASVVVALVLFMVGLRLFMVLRIKRQEGKPVPELTGKLGRTAKSRRPSLFYFYSPSCGPCKAMTLVVQKMGRTDRNVVAVDISKDLDTARRFGVMATPTVVKVKQGVVQQVLVGPQPESELRALLAAG